MAAIDRFIKVLSPLGIYGLSENSRTYRELLSYSKEFDLLQSESDLLLRELFIATAETYGLSSPERIYTAPDESVGLAERRRRLLNRFNIGDGSFTPEAIGSAVKDFGAESFQITEYPSRYSIVVEISGDYSNAGIDFIKKEIKKIMPAHLNTEVYFNGISWNEIDSRDLSFDTIDGKDYAWSYIDEIKI